MSTPVSQGLLWWDRERDSHGRTIRPDVRRAAREVSQLAFRLAEKALSDPHNAAGLMEKTVVQVSRYLDRTNSPMFGRQISGLIMCAFIRSARRIAVRERRIQLLQDLDEIKAPNTRTSFNDELNMRIDAARVFECLNLRARKMHELRNEGFSWKEIASTLGINSVSARAEYSRELRNVRKRLRLY